jgi:hypothetical protein
MSVPKSREATEVSVQTGNFTAKALANELVEERESLRLVLYGLLVSPSTSVGRNEFASARNRTVADDGGSMVEL